jgi:protein transport protein YIF1
MRAGTSYTNAKSQKSKRTYFLALYAFLVQMLFMWILSREEAAVKTVASKLTGPKA